MQHKSVLSWLWRRAGILLPFLIITVLPASAQDKYFSISGQGYYDDHAIISINADGSNALKGYDVTANYGYIPPSGAMIPYRGLLYGTFGGGGSYPNGFLYSYDPATNNLSILYALNGGDEGSLNAGGQLTVYPNGKLYGAAGNGGANNVGVIYNWDPVANSFTKCADLPGPTSCCAGVTPLTFYNYKLYGANAYGGAFGNGYLYSFDPLTNSVTKLNDFTTRTQTTTPMIVYNNKLYGIQQGAGPYNAGLIFSYDPVGGFQPVYSFDNVHGAQPYQILGYQGKLYGVSTSGGANNKGTIFSFDLAAGQAADLYDFDNNNINNPVGIVIDSVSGSMTGFTAGGGPSGTGTFFHFDLATNQITTFDPGSAGPATQGIVFVPGTGGTTVQTVNFNTLPARVYGDPDLPAGATVSSGLPITYISSDLNVAWINGDQIHVVGAGTTTITATQAGNATYAPQSASQPLTVNRPNLIIGVKDTVMHQTDPVPSFTLTYTGFVNGDSLSSLLTPPVAATPANTGSPLNQYPITISGATSNNYNITYQPGVLTVIGPGQNIAFTDTLKTYGDADFATATVNTGLPLTYASSNPAVAIITPNGKIHIAGAGRDTITISQGGNADYGYTSISAPLTVLPATLSIAVNDDSSIYRQAIPAFTATYTGLVNGDTPDSLQAVFSSAGAEANAMPGAYLINAVAIRPKDSINYNITANQPGTLLIHPAGGDKDKNSMDTWFSSPGSLQVAVFASQQTAPGHHVSLKVFDVTGRPCLNTQLNLAWGYNTFSFPVTNLSAGVYIVRLSGEGIQVSKTITKLL